MGWGRAPSERIITVFPSRIEAPFRPEASLWSNNVGPKEAFVPRTIASFAGAPLQTSVPQPEPLSGRRPERFPPLQESMTAPPGQRMSGWNTSRPSPGVESAGSRPRAGGFHRPTPRPSSSLGFTRGSSGVDAASSPREARPTEPVGATRQVIANGSPLCGVRLRPMRLLRG